jgi:O-antigen ligase
MLAEYSARRTIIFLIAALLAAVFSVCIVSLHYSVIIASALILAGLGVSAIFCDYRIVYKLLFILLPLSFELPLGMGDSKIQFPSEALVIILAVAWAGRFLFTRSVKKEYFRHPLILAALAYLLILCVTTITSQLPVVSAKFTAVYVAYIIVFCFLFFDMFRKDKNSAMQMIYLYGLSISLVIIYMIIDPFSQNVRYNPTNIAVQPFYSDHGIFSACLAMLIPAFAAIVFKGSLFGFKLFQRRMAALALVLFCTGMAYACSRAAMISLLAASGLYVLMRLKIKFRTLLFFLFMAVILFCFNRNTILQGMKQNRYVSSRKNATLTERTMSVTNIKSDVSNAERLNRWNCAYRMFLDKPLTGFGPGTYQFEYLSYQRYDEMTEISVTSPYNITFGKGGTAHSEYMLALAETGILGFLFFAVIAVGAIFYCFRIYYNATGEWEKILASVCLTSLTTYLVHTVFNNYLNIDKAASLFWLFTSLTVLLSVRKKEINTGRDEINISAL